MEEHRTGVPSLGAGEGRLFSRRAQIRKYRAASKAANTKRALEKNLSAFATWCEAEGVSGFPCAPERLEAYLVHMVERGLKAATIDQARWAINAQHKLQGFPAPGDVEQVKVLMAGIKRSIGSRQHRKAALTIEHIKRIPFGNSLIDKRNKALLLIGFAAGLRRSELAALRVEDLEPLEEGLRLHINTSKTDQEGWGDFVDVVPASDPRHCPVAALHAWLAECPGSRRPLFPSISRWGRLGRALSTVSISNIVKAAAEACGMDAAAFGGHSLRAGCATYLLDKGVPLNIVARQGRWKRQDTVLRYDRNQTTRALNGVY